MVQQREHVWCETRLCCVVEPRGARTQARGAQGAAVSRAEVPQASTGAADEPDGPARVARPPRPPWVKHERPDRLLLRSWSRRRRRGSSLETAQRFRVLARHCLVHQLHGQLQELRQVYRQSLRLGVWWVPHFLYCLLVVSTSKDRVWRSALKRTSRFFTSTSKVILDSGRRQWILSWEGWGHLDSWEKIAIYVA